MLSWLVLHLQGMVVAFLLGAVPAEPGAQGAGPQLVAALPSPEQVPAVLPALCPSVSAELAVLQHDQTLPPAAEPPASLTATSASSASNLLGMQWGPPACKNPPARPFGELVPEGETPQKQAWQSKSWLRQLVKSCESTTLLPCLPRVPLLGASHEECSYYSQYLWAEGGCSLHHPSAAPHSPTCSTWCCNVPTVGLAATDNFLPAQQQRTLQKVLKS